MKREIILSVGFAIGLGQSASAEGPARNPESLGMVEAILSKCATIDSEHAARYRGEALFVKHLEGSGGQSNDKSQNNTGYKWAYDTASASLDALAPASAMKICRSVLVDVPHPTPKLRTL